MRVSDNVYLQMAIKKWTKWWATMDIVGCSLFGSRYLRSALNVQFHAPPQVNSRHMPCASLHAAAPSQCLIISIIVIIIILLLIIIITIIIIILIIIIRLAIRIFRHPFAPYPTVRWKWQVRASIGTAKRHIGVCANTDRVFFPARCVCLTMYTSKWLLRNGLSDEQPWTSWGALFSDPDISALLWMSSSMPPPQVNSRHMPCASLHAAAPSQCLLEAIGSCRSSRPTGSSFWGLVWLMAARNCTVTHTHAYIDDAFTSYMQSTYTHYN